MMKRTWMVGALVIAVCIAGVAVTATAGCFYRQLSARDDRLQRTGDTHWYSIDLLSGQRYRFNLSVPYSADFDIYIYRVTRDHRGAITRTLVASGTRGTGQYEEVFYTVPWGRGGTYHVRIVSYRGTGSYRLWCYRRHCN